MTDLLIGTFNSNSRKSVSKFSGLKWLLLFVVTISKYVKQHLTGELFAGVNSKICNNCATLGCYSPYFGMTDFSNDN